MNIDTLVKQEILKLDPAAEVILFGSRARGDFRPDSDWDFLILLTQALSPTRKSLILEALYDLELQTDTVISAIIHSKTEWESLEVTPIYKAIQREGKRA